jgi:hypothetical protein
VGVASLLDSLAALDALTGRLTDRRLLAPSRCAGWAAVDTLCHLHMGLQEMLTGFVSPTDDEPTVDFASYWTAFAAAEADPDPVPGMLRTRRVASSYSRPTNLLRHMTPTLQAVRSAAGASDPAARLRFQGFVLTVDDFATTWAVETVIHHLDVVDGDDSLPGPASQGLFDARRTVERLLGSELPAAWDDTTATLKATGRLPLDAADRQLLGPAADRLPVLG